MKNHIAITGCDDMAAMMLPQLTKHGITVFNYYKIYFDGSVVRLSTDSSWTTHYFKKNYINQLTVPDSYLTKQLNYYLWLTDDCPEMLLDAALNFDTSNGISIAERHANYIEYFCFATTLKNTSIINNFYLNNLDLLRKYCFYFKEQARHLLEKGEKGKIILTNKEICRSEFQYNFAKELKLSNQQSLCARLLLQGMKYKEIANELGLSSRTVESYFNNLKEKLKCRNRTELIVRLIEMFE